MELDYSDYKPLGRTGERVPAIGIGTWAIRDYNKAFHVLVEAVERGLWLIDTAEMYHAGRAEELVGRVVETVGRDKVFIVTKMLPENLVSEESIEKSTRASLKRLRVSYVDLYLIHWPHYAIPIEEQVRRFELVYRRGYTRYIGVSNFDKWELERAIQATRSTEIVADQVKYSVLDRGIELSLLPYAQEKQVTIQAYTPLERGRVKDHPLLQRIAAKYGKTPVQIALNYLISKPMVTAIVKTENMQHLREILGSLGWRLKPEDIKELTRA